MFDRLPHEAGGRAPKVAVGWCLFVNKLALRGWTKGATEVINVSCW
jgi:hypothetical protein